MSPLPKMFSRKTYQAISYVRNKIQSFVRKKCRIKSSLTRYITDKENEKQ